MKQSVSASVSVISNNHIFREWSQFHLDKNGLMADYLTPDFLLTNKGFKKNDIFILDVQSSYISALDSIKVIKKLGAASKVIAILEGASDYYLSLIFKSNIDALVSSEELSSLTLNEIITAVKENKIYISEKFKNIILGNIRQSNQSNINLTQRELQIINLLGSGKSSSEIALLLHCSPKTINVHRANIKEKLKIKHNHEFIKYCFESTR